MDRIGPMMGQFSDTLLAHEPTQVRRLATEARYQAALTKIAEQSYFPERALTVFVAGSMGRGEMGERSDLDLFLISAQRLDAAEETDLIAALDRLNADLGYPS